MVDRHDAISLRRIAAALIGSRDYGATLEGEYRQNVRTSLRMRARLRVCVDMRAYRASKQSSARSDPGAALSGSASPSRLWPARTASVPTNTMHATARTSR